MAPDEAQIGLLKLAQQQADRHGVSLRDALEVVSDMLGQADAHLLLTDPSSLPELRTAAAVLLASNVV